LIALSGGRRARAIGMSFPHIYRSGQVVCHQTVMMGKTAL
jgi:hypothetical protein